jgi:hypothetical protein
MKRLAQLLSSPARRTRSNGTPARQRRLTLEHLDDRCLPSTSPVTGVANLDSTSAIELSADSFTHRHPSLSTDLESAADGHVKFVKT